MTLNEAWILIEQWRRHYDEVRPYNPLKGVIPKEYAEIAAGPKSAVFANFRKTLKNV